MAPQLRKNKRGSSQSVDQDQEQEHNNERKEKGKGKGKEEQQQQQQLELTAALGTFGNVKKKLKSLHEDMKFLVNRFWEQKMDKQTKDANFLKMIEEPRCVSSEASS